MASLRLVLSAVCGCWLASSTLIAQTQFSELRKSRGLPWDTDDTYALATGDIDGDGDLDLVKGLHGRTQMFVNDGFGSFVDESSVRLPVNNDRTEGLVLADLDRDGDLDLVLANDGQQCRFFANTGSGVFADLTAQLMPAGAYPVQTVDAADVDGDGDLDLALGGPFMPLMLYRNRGTGRFIDVSATTLPGTAAPARALAFGDLDADGDADLVIAGDALLLAYTNLGGGFFANLGTMGFPAFAQPARSLALGDLDADGDLDLVVGNDKELPRLYRNAGTGIFVDETGSSRWSFSVNYYRDEINDLALGDVDADGDLDVVLGARADSFVIGGLRREANLVFRNNGLASFTDASGAAFPANVDDPTEAIALADVDGDADLDLIVGNVESSFDYVRYNDGRGMLWLHSGTRMPQDYYVSPGVALGDIDGDLDLDAVAAHTGSLAPASVGQSLYVNDGTGILVSDRHARLPMIPQYLATVVRFADLDGDADLDLVFGGDQGTWLHLNQGPGLFVESTAGRIPSSPYSTNGLEVADVDRDGDADLFLANARSYFIRDARNQLWLNDGTARFLDVSTTHLPPDAGASLAIAAGDVNGDGYADLIVANGVGAYRQNNLLLNDGAGRFADVTRTQFPVDADESTSVALGDVDRDGDLDAVFGNLATPNSLYLNDGAGYFTDASAISLPRNADDTKDLELLDYDEDGDLDLYVANDLQPSRLYRNDGAGNFADVSSLLPPENYRVISAAHGDLDFDGDPDLLLGTYGFTTHVLVNLHRQLAAPFATVIGNPLRLDSYGAPTSPFAVQSVIWIGTRRLSIPVPIPGHGSLLVDPSTVQLFANLTHGSGLAPASIHLVVPRNPGLIGVRAYFTNLVMHSPSIFDWRLGPLVTEVVLR